MRSSTERYKIGWTNIQDLANAEVELYMQTNKNINHSWWSKFKFFLINVYGA